MVGTYGEVYQPLVVDEHFDYILFSNDIKDSSVGVWQVRTFPVIIENDDKRLSRYPKTHPAELLAEYAASLYIDANLQIVDKWVYERFIELYNSDINIAGVQLKATGRDCIYRHSYDMCIMGAEHDYNAILQMRKLRKLGFPDHWGLNENNCIWRRHTEQVKSVDDEWWWWITKYSFRDQFSYMYCLWHNGIERSFFIPQKDDTGSSGYFIRYHHNDNPTIASKKWVKMGFWEFIRNKCWTQSFRTYNHYCNQWVLLSYLPFPRCSLWLLGVISILPCSLYWIARKLYHMFLQRPSVISKDC